MFGVNFLYILINLIEINALHSLTQQDCPSGKVKCEKGYNYKKNLKTDYTDCIEKYWVCDDSFDCTDGSDEKYCSYNYNFGYSGFTYHHVQGVCSNGQFMCQRPEWRNNVLTNICIIDMSRACNGLDGCDDGSDERYCPYKTIFHFEFSQSGCLKSNYKCRTSSHCIKKSDICDGTKDCPDNSDEKYCPYIFPNSTIRFDKIDEGIKKITNHLDELKVKSTNKDDFKAISLDIKEIKSITANKSELINMTQTVEELKNITSDQSQIITDHLEELKQITKNKEELKNITENIKELKQISDNINELGNLTAINQLKGIKIITENNEELINITESIKELKNITDNINELKHKTEVMEEFNDFLITSQVIIIITITLLAIILVINLIHLKQNNKFKVGDQIILMPLNET